MDAALEKCLLGLAEILAQRSMMLVTAESCTGGGVSAAITTMPGCSHWFDRGFVTYSRQSKRDMLGVQADTLAQYGAVSEQVVVEMANGAVRRSQAGISLAVSGVAGPGGGSADKPVGTVCFAWALEGQSLEGPSGEKYQVHSCTEHFSGDRAAVRRQAVLRALEGALALLGGEVQVQSQALDSDQDQDDTVDC